MSKNMKRLEEVMDQLDPSGKIVKVKNGVIRIQWSRTGVTRTFVSRNFENSAKLALDWMEPVLRAARLVK